VAKRRAQERVLELQEAVVDDAVQRLKTDVHREIETRAAGVHSAEQGSFHQAQQGSDSHGRDHDAADLPSPQQGTARAVKEGC
jgi:hypothetical protein